jgi:hypothetical protein
LNRVGTACAGAEYKRTLAPRCFAVDHVAVNRRTLPCLIDSTRAARSRLLRVLFLAFALIVANGIAPWSTAMAASAPAMHGDSSAHHCHDSASKTAPAKATQHGNTCPCCSAGCFCLHGSAAPLPEFAGIPALVPPSVVVQHTSSVPLAPSLAEHLRPPIA